MRQRITAKLSARVRSLFPATPLHTIKRVFKIIYGRAPTSDELPALQALATLPARNTWHLFRTIISRYDQQTKPTPFQVRFSMDDLAYIASHGFLLAIDQADVAVSLPLQQQHYEQHMLAFYQKWLKAGMTFLDIGANIGLYTMLAAQRVGASGRVICFEPNSENCRLILLSLAKNGFQNVTLMPVALSAQPGYTLFTTHLGSNGSFLQLAENALMSANCVVVPTARLDDLVQEKVDFIKMDVEGAEGLVLKGARHLIEKHRPYITSEFSLEMLARVSNQPGREYLRYFKSQGYAIFLIDRTSAELIEVPDVDSFIDNYGTPIRIEDLAFLPHPL